MKQCQQLKAVWLRKEIPFQPPDSKFLRTQCDKTNEYMCHHWCLERFLVIHICKQYVNAVISISNKAN